jgi:predicted dehydrogenase
VAKEEEEELLRGAILGTGSISVHHMRAWQALPGVQIVALANRTRDRAIALGREFGINETHIYADYRELLGHEKIDFVDIATAPHVHREQVLAAAAHRVHVLCQKPFATSMAEAMEMIRACELTGVRCVVNENWRWRRWYREVKQMIQQGVVGRPRYARFHHHTDEVLANQDGSLPALLTTQPYEADLAHLILFDWGIHLIDVMRFLFGDIERVYAHMSRVSPLVRGEDMAVVLLEFRANLVGLIDISWGTRVPPEQCLIRGNLDVFSVEGDAGTIEFDPHQEDLILVTTSRGTERRRARLGQTPAEAYQESYLNAHGHFLRCLRSGEPAENEVRDNLKTFAATMAAYESAKRRAFVEVGID